MRRLCQPDASKLLAFVSELTRLDEPLAFPPRVLASLHTLIESDAVAYSELDPLHQSSILQVHYAADGASEVMRGNHGWAESRDLWWRVRHTHPLCGYRAASADWTTARKVSDFATLGQFRRTPIYHAFYRGEINYWLDVGLAPTPTRTRVFVFVRHKGSDFDERDRLVADLLQPHLAERAEAAEAALRTAVAFGTIEEGASDETSGLVLCSREGVIEYAAPSSRALLQRYLQTDSGRVPRWILRRPTLVLAHAPGRLHIKIARSGNLHVLMLDERDSRIETLTARERQILDRAALGKENDEIALGLGIAPATVAKHLEHVYRKLAVPNRTAAAALLRRDLGAPAESPGMRSSGTASR